ncbi:MAG: metallophosphoesterase [Kiritimatiellae bacterium]|nr:metallophosphoesterase [Kiritimatiellia bacterium]
MLRFGIVTDCHYADIASAGTRYYRESDGKLAECVAAMNAERADFLIELGDFKDQGDTAETTLGYLRDIEQVYAGFNGPRYHVLGNHDMDRISKAQFQSVIKNTGIAPERTYYSFDNQGFHFVVLDANYLADGTNYDSGNFDWTKAYVPQHELTWLAQDLATAAPRPVVVFIHQLLDADEGPVYVRNAAAVRAVLEACGRVRAVFQGHHHSGSYRKLGGIHYYTLKAVIEGSGAENSAYALVSAYADGRLSVNGFRRAESRELAGLPACTAGITGCSRAITVDTRTAMQRYMAQGTGVDTRTVSACRSRPATVDTLRHFGTILGLS